MARAYFILVRVDKLEKEKYHKGARARRLTLSDYIRKLLIQDIKRITF